MNRRASSFDWMSAPDEGDAAAGVRDVAAWLASPRPERDWEAVLGPLRDALTRLTLSPLVRGDARCRAILAGLASAADMAELGAGVAALARRVDEMGAARSRPAAEAPRPARRTIRI